MFTNNKVLRLSLLGVSRQLCGLGNMLFGRPELAQMEVHGDTLEHLNAAIKFKSMDREARDNRHAHGFNFT
jgi:hypothetical protein